MAKEIRLIFEYDNYRTFLKDRFDYLKELNPKFSHRQFAKLAGFKSSSFLFSVMAAKANFSLEAIEGVTEALELNKDESYFFKNLVLLNQATTPDERILYARQVLKSKSYRRTQVLAESTYHYFTHWYYVAIKEMVGLKDFQSQPEWIAKRLGDFVPVEDVQRAIEELLKIGILVRDSENNLKQAQDVIVTPDEVTSAFVVTYHEELIHLGAAAIRRFKREQREISATTFIVSEEDLEKVKDVIQRFKKEIIEMVAKNTGTDGVYQLNMQLFPIAPILSKYGTKPAK